jgi:hypothetical protein
VVVAQQQVPTIWQDDRLDGGWKEYELSQSQYEEITALGKSGWRHPVSPRAAPVRRPATR